MHVETCHFAFHDRSACKHLDLGHFSLNYGCKQNFVRACGHLGQLTVNITEHFARYVDFAPEKGRQ